jgi:LCP family protein required for cell wall assembly
MMVLHVPADGRKATVFAIPRDSYVAIPGHGMNKINSAYAFGYNDGNGNKSTAARLAVQTVQNLTGLTIDHFVQADLIGFYRISNAIGGVQVNLCAAAKEKNSGINLPKGISTIKAPRRWPSYGNATDSPTESATWTGSSASSISSPLCSASSPPPGYCSIIQAAGPAQGRVYISDNGSEP